MMRLAEAMGRSVVARDSAETVGSIQGAMVDAESGRIVALQVDKGHKARLADWTSLTGFGPDAVVVDTEASLRAPNGEREERVIKGDIALLGGLVLTTRGDGLGLLRDVEFDEETGELVTLVGDDTPVLAARLRSVGSYAIVVATEERVSG